MSDNVTANPSSGGATFKTDEVGGVHTPVTKIAFGADGTITTVDETNKLPVSVTFPETQTINGTVTANTGLVQPVTDAQLRASDVKVSLDGEQLAISNFPAVQTVNGAVTAYTGLDQPLTDDQLRASPIALPSGASTEATLEQMRVLYDTLLFYMAAVLEKMPRVTGNDQAAVSLEGGSVSTVTTVGTVTTVSQLGTRAAMTAADAQIMQGTSHIYSNISVA